MALRPLGHADPAEVGRIHRLLAAFAVDSAVFRQGVGSTLLRDLLRALGERQVTVPTGVDNLPAIGPYGKHGFVPSSRWSTPDGVRMVTLRRSSG